MNIKAIALGLAALASVAIAPARAAPPADILNVSYDVSRELFAQINPVFEADWKTKTGQAIEVKQSHGGSSSQARAVLEGLQADVVTFNQVTDINVLHDKGQLVPADWQTRLANKSSPFYSLPAFLVRKGNPKKIKTWDDLVKPGIGIIIPNPKTSGNGRYSYLAAYAYALEKNKGDKEKAKAFAKAFLGNVVVFDAGGRAATTTFVERGLGDVLITFEAEAYGTQKAAGADKFDVVTPSVSLLAEFPVSVVDKVVDARGSREVATAYLQFLYTPAAQDIIARNFYRVNDKAVAKKYAGQFPNVRLLSVEQTLGGWENVAKEHLAAGGVLDQVFVNR
jgi:sulfate/thiosulfate transport system substrate-binding protein